MTLQTKNIKIDSSDKCTQNFHALVWFARIIQWEFPDFSVDTHLENLLDAQKILEEHGTIDGSIHRFLLVAQK